MPPGYFCLYLGKKYNFSGKIDIVSKILPLYQKNKTFPIQELKKLLELILYPRNKQLCDRSVYESVINSLIRK